MKTLKNLLLPAGLFGGIFFVLAAFSVISLFIYGLGFGTSSLIKTISSTYSSVMDSAFGYADPWLTKLVELIKHTLNLEVSISNHWRPVFILMVGYFYQDAAAAWDLNRKPAAIVHLIIGLIVSLISSLSSAVLAGSYKYWAAALPVVGLFVYTLAGRTWGYFFEPYILEGSASKSRYFKKRVGYALLRTIVFLGIIQALLMLDVIRRFNSPEIVALTLISALIGLYWIGEGIRDARLIQKVDKSLDESFLTTFARSPYTKVGVMVVRAHFAAAGIIAIGSLYDIIWPKK